MGNQPSIRMPNMKYIDIFTSKNVLKCLGFVPEDLDGSYKPLIKALGKGGVMRKNLGVLSTLVRGGLQATFVRSQIDNDYTAEDFEVDLSPSNLILAQYDLRGGKKTSLRGMALCQIKYNGVMVTTDLRLAKIDINKVSMELIVLGNALPSDVILRKSVDIQGGGNMIRLVQYIGSKLPKGVFLNGLETVLPLYHHFGWRIYSSRNAEDISCPISESRAVTRQYDVPTNAGKFMKDNGPPPYTVRQNDELTKILSYAHGKHEYKERNNGQEGHQEVARDNGYPMILCPENNPYHIVTRQGGGRRKRTRTGKKALRKRHRHTRHKKKRRKTHKRKRRHKTRKRLRSII